MVIDIQTFDVSSLSDENIFIVDANVLLYIHCPKVVMCDPNVASEYSKFIGQLMKKNCSIWVSSVNLQETLNVIERMCWKRYNKSQKIKVKRKKFRAIIAERQKVKKEQTDFLNQIKQIYDIKTDSISQNELTSYTDNLEKHRYDPIDYIISNHYGKSAGIVTNDADFTYDNNIIVYILS